MSSSGLWPAPVLHPGACNVADCSKRIHATADDSVSARHRPAERPANATAKPGGYTNRPTPITSRVPTKPNKSVSGTPAAPGIGSGPRSRPIRPATAEGRSGKKGSKRRKRGQFLILYNLRLAAFCGTKDGSDNRACPSPYARRSTPPSSSSPPPSARSSVSATPPETSPRLDTSRAESA